jgi:hypothetical protein
VSSPASVNNTPPPAPLTGLDDVKPPGGLVWARWGPALFYHQYHH